MSDFRELYEQNDQKTLYTAYFENGYILKIHSYTSTHKKTIRIEGETK